KRSFTWIHFQQRLEALELLHSAPPGLFWYGNQIGGPDNTFARTPIWRGFANRNTFKFALAQFPDDKVVQAGVVNNNESLVTPANRASYSQLQRGCHGPFPS